MCMFYSKLLCLSLSVCVLVFVFQAEEEGRLREQVAGLTKEMSSEKSRTAELQKALEQSQQGLAKLQADYYGKESEVSATRQDLKVSGRGSGLCVTRRRLCLLYK